MFSFLVHDNTPGKAILATGRIWTAEEFFPMEWVIDCDDRLPHVHRWSVRPENRHRGGWYVNRERALCPVCREFDKRTATGKPT